jgi:hypothetical protein
MNNVRFKVWHNGQYTKLTLRPDQTLEFGGSYRTEEGYHWEYDRYTYHSQAKTVTHEFAEGGRDCDGYSSEKSVWVIDAERLTMAIHPALGMFWRRIEHGQRDMTAEAAGY